MKDAKKRALYEQQKQAVEQARRGSGGSRPAAVQEGRFKQLEEQQAQPMTRQLLLPHFLPPVQSAKPVIAPASLAVSKHLPSTVMLLSRTQLTLFHPQSGLCDGLRGACEVRREGPRCDVPEEET